MDFEQILREWEERRKNTVSRNIVSDAAEEKVDNAEKTNWLELYPPGSDVLTAKNTSDIPPVSEGRSVWLRRAHQDTLDLHGLNGSEARGAIERFIRSMRSKNLRKGLIIHGKGLHSQDGSVLQPLVRDFLEQSNEVGEFGKASRKDGGSGATWFLLRHRSR